MLIRFVEYFLINIFNGVKRRSKPAASLTPPKIVPRDYAVLGHLIPATKLPAKDLIAKQLNDAGVVALSPEARLRHLYILGATGTGKTNLLLRLIESDIKNKRAFCVIDLRGDLVDRILLRLADAAPAKAWKERLLLIDLRDGTQAVGFNPLAGEADVYTRALHMLAVLKQQSDSWGVQLEETLRNSLLALAETNWTLLEIEPLLTNRAFRDQVLEEVQDSRVRSFFERFNELSSAEQIKWTLPVLNKITPLLSLPALRLMFGQRQGFSFRHLFDEQPGMVILVSLAADRLHDAARVAGGLLISSVQTAIMARVDVPEAERVPAHLYIDEFECMATDRFEAIVAEGRRFKLGLTLSHQNLSQLPLNLRHVIRNNIHTQVYFQTGAVDAGELAKEISGGKASDEVRALLMSQGTGEAFLMRRHEPRAQMRTLRSLDPQIVPHKIQQLRAVSGSTYARSRVAVEQELREREESFRQMKGLNGKSLRRTAPGETVYEIRHDKLDHFGVATPMPASTPMPTPPVIAQNCNELSPDLTAPDTQAATTASPPPISNSARRILKPKAVDIKRERKSKTSETPDKTKGGDANHGGSNSPDGKRDDNSAGTAQ